ncbi:hypothetical protein D4R52_01310 [bacterium]|nr:MAG: hypothetical protein D4R52_01310 [bacterium]
MTFEFLETSKQPLFLSAVFSIVVLFIAWYEYRGLRKKLLDREEEMKHRMYELAILRELGERIGYSLNVQKIVDIISGSLGNLLPYSTVVYMLPAEEGRLLFHVNLAESVSKAFIADVRGRMLKSISSLFSKPYTESDVDESISGVVTDPTSPDKVLSFFNIPIVINDKPAGVFTVASTKSGLYKTSEEVDILYTIMNQASEAVSKLQTVLEIEKGKLNSMVSSMADGVLMVDTANRLLVINPKTVMLLGLPQNSQPDIFAVLNAVSNHLDLRTKIEESLKTDKVIVEDNIQLNDHFLQILISPVKDNHNEPIGGVVLFHDITHEKELEKMRDDFTSMMVHELRSPLTGIRSISDLLKNEKIKNDEAKYQEFIRLISTNSNSMLGLVNDLLDISKLESGKFQVFKAPANLRNTLKQRVESFASLAAETKLTLQEVVDPRVPETVVMDENKVGQVLNNLLSNAIKFTQPGGKITLAAFLASPGQDLADLATAANASWQGLRKGLACDKDSAVISVSDTGMGIAESEIPQLFNKFQQLAASAKSEKKGTGLGLVIVKGIVEAHGGKVGILSEEGKGTTFYFSIPLEAQKTPVAAAAKQ